MCFILLSLCKSYSIKVREWYVCNEKICLLNSLGKEMKRLIRMNSGKLLKRKVENKLIIISIITITINTKMKMVSHFFSEDFDILLSFFISPSNFRFVRVRFRLLILVWYKVINTLKILVAFYFNFLRYWFECCYVCVSSLLFFFNQRPFCS